MPIPADLPPIALDDRFDEMRRVIRADGRSDLCEPRDKDHRLCHCASCMETYEAGLKLATQLLENQCPTYVAGVVAVMSSVASMAMARVFSADPKMDMSQALAAQMRLDDVFDTMTHFCNNAHSIEQTFRAVQASMKRD